MDINFLDKEINLKKNLNNLDEFVISFSSILDKTKIKYVLVSGYISILFGRSRSSEDIDIIIEKIDFTRFHKLWTELNNKFECINTTDSKKAYDEYLTKDTSIRFSKKGNFIPNMEVKFPDTNLEKWALDNRKTIFLNKNKLYISPLELQISFKIFLGSEKDIEDAKYLYELFKDKLDKQLLKEFNRKLKIEELFNKYIL